MVLIDVPVDLCGDLIALQGTCIVIEDSGVIAITVDQEITQVVQVTATGASDIVAKIERSREFIFLTFVVQEKEQFVLNYRSADPGPIGVGSEISQFLSFLPVANEAGRGFTG